MEETQIMSKLWKTAAELAERTPPERNRYADLLRALSIAAVVFGHWLVAAPYMDNGALVAGHMLAIEPWTQWLTLFVQVMPIFFLVGGYSNGIAWRAAQRDGRSYAEWLGVRLQRLMVPVIPVLVFWIGLALVTRPLGIASELLDLGSQAALVPTWFLSVYVMVAVLVPITHAAWQRFGMLSFAVLVAAAAAVDALVLGAGLPGFGYANYAFVWLAVHQLGYFWLDGGFRGYKNALPWALLGAVGLAILIVPGPYPLSMVGVPGRDFGNSAPPTLALLVLGIVQTGLVLSIEAPMRRLLQNARFWTATVLVNGMIMTLYLWHMTAMIAVFGLAYLGGGFGLDVTPGTGLWWALQPLWMLAFCIGLIPLFALFVRFERMAPETISLSRRRLVLGASLTCWGLFLVSNTGIMSPGTLGIKLLPAMLPVIGAGIASFGPFARVLGVRTAV